MPIKRKNAKTTTNFKNRKTKRQNIDQDKDFEIESDISSDLEEDVPTTINNEEVATETIEEKRNRITTEYLNELKKVKDEDAINLQLTEEAMASAGKRFNEIALKLENINISSTIYKGHKNAVTCIKINDKGTTAYTGSKDNCLIQWDVETGKRVHVFKGSIELPFSDEILCVAEQDGMVYCGGRDKIITMYDPRSKLYVDKLKGHHGAINALALQENGRSLYSGSDDRTIKVWNIEERAYVESLYGHEEAVRDLDALKAERVLSTAGDKTCRIWKVIEESQLVYRGNEIDYNIERVKYINPETFVSSNQNGTMDLWSTQKKKPIFSIQSTESSNYWSTSLATMHYTDLVASASYDGFIKIWKYNREEKNLKLNGFINDMSISKNGILVGTISQEHRFGRWFRNANVKNGIFVSKLGLEL